jgi:hypothetical protein
MLAKVFAATRYATVFYILAKPGTSVFDFLTALLHLSLDRSVSIRCGILGRSRGRHDCKKDECRGESYFG